MQHLFILYILNKSINFSWNLTSLLNSVLPTILLIYLSILWFKVSILDQRWYILLRALWSYSLCLWRRNSCRCIGWIRESMKVKTFWENNTRRKEDVNDQNFKPECFLWFKSWLNKMSMISLPFIWNH